jgi:hypothetical protein
MMGQNKNTGIILSSDTGSHEMVDSILLVWADFQTCVRDADIMQSRNKVGYELQNWFTFMSSSEHDKFIKSAGHFAIIGCGILCI